jgi:hypothetical protein
MMELLMVQVRVTAEGRMRHDGVVVQVMVMTAAEGTGSATAVDGMEMEG